MQRIIEPELMNEENQSYAYAQADFEEPNIHFMNLFQETFSQKFHGHVLDIGCGNADITLRFAKTYPNCLIDGIDGSTSMLSYGHKVLNEQPLDVQKRVRLMAGIVPNIKLPQLHYGVIISNSVLHHLHNPSVLWQFIKSYGVDGTRVFIGDLLRPSSPKKAMEIVDLYAKNEPDILKRDFYNSLLAAFEISEIKEQLKLANIDNLSVKQISDRHVLISGFLQAN
ncbi:MAG: class I SAM-dependent methyltransferase [Pleurocapsa sp. MO_192.B19]|nr:class I SAM-dependent methyltransferase [Pleurocapsa sp. MO_192.B19]